jgi:hypothetical protein
MLHTIKLIKFQNVILFTFILFIFSNSNLFADTPDYTPATLTGDMTSLTESQTPANRDRTTVGIAEKVTCSIGSCTWEDKDCDESGTQIVYDTIGNRIWSCYPAGTVNPTAGTNESNDAIFTAPMYPFRSTTVWVYVYDSALYHDDASYISKGIDFEIIAPNSITATFSNDVLHLWDDWESGPKYLAAASQYIVTIEPASVSFYNAYFQENFGEGDSDTWPDGSTWYGPTGTIGPTCPVNYANELVDMQASPFYNSDVKLYTGSEYQDFYPTFSIPYDYYNEYYGWIQFGTMMGCRSYYKENRTTIVGVDSECGGAQGPFQGD